MLSVPLHSTAFRSVHAGCCLFLFSMISWALLTPDPFAVVDGGPLQLVARLDDLILHFGVFIVFAAACLSLIADAREYWVRLTVMGLLCLHAIGTECLQAFVPGRTCDPLDGLANLSGIAAAYILVRLAIRRLRPHAGSLTVEA